MFGASGFYYDGSYYSCSPEGIVYKSSTLDFGNQDVLRYDSKEAENVRRLLAEQDALQKVLLGRVFKGEYR
jgi:hypothetical protein